MAQPAATYWEVSPESIREEFQRLKEQWKEETGLLSSSTQIVLSQPYQRIIGLGKPAVPLILEELRRGPDHWFWALSAITGEDPVPRSDWGKLEKMRQAWLAWAEARNL